jgi:hypothetical protein
MRGVELLQGTGVKAGRWLLGHGRSLSTIAAQSPGCDIRTTLLILSIDRK